MCGIAGFHEMGEYPVLWGKEKESLIKMLDLQGHRGPDDRGIVGYSFTDEYSNETNNPDIMTYKLNGVIGFNRLSIRDLSMNGHQPMKSKDSKVVLAFNGEIYNADEWRHKLKKKGYQFNGSSDTEVILNLYLEFGLEETVKMLNGMIAIVLIDLRKRQVYLARDRFGIKPLYYTILNNRLYYASEYKSFLAIEGFNAQLDVDALYECMIFISSMKKNLLQGVKQVSPGEILIINNDGIRHINYFDINSYERPVESNDFQNKKEMLEDVVKKAVHRQMISDVKLGCQLSGGVDSSLISFFATENKNNPMRDSESIVFSDSTLNEEQWIMEVAERLRLEVHNYRFDISFLLDNISRIIWHLESILTVPNAAALFLLTQNARNDVTVLLSGEGADETFAGYSNHISVYLRHVFVQNEEIRKYLTNKTWIHKKLFGDFAGNELYTAVMEMCYVKPEDVARMLNRPIDDSIIEQRYEKIESYRGNILDKYIKYEMQTYLPELLLRQDKMSMANSIENRVPFLDNCVVEASFQVPLEYMLCVNKRMCTEKSNVGLEQVVGKYILKEICAEKYGDRFAYRSKYGFGIPLKYFMGTEEFKYKYREELKNGIMHRGILNADYVKWLYDRLPVLDWRETELLWRAINVEIYAQLYLDKKII